jgi:N-acetylmuramoyl-L-alanine amidase
MSLLSGSWPWRALRRVSLWRHALLFRWYTWDKANLAFLAIPGSAVALLGGFGWFAYADHARLVAAERRQADLTCLAQNIYFEARGEPLAGQYAVAEVTMNRVSSQNYPDSVCDVVHEQHWNARERRYIGAFSWTELELLPRPKGPGWQRAMTVAETVYDERHAPSVPSALFYHADYVHPAWAKAKTPVAEIGSHIFYE